MKRQDEDAPYEIIPALAIVAVVLVLLLSGCAFQPIVDHRAGPGQAVYAQDLAECQQYAEQLADPATAAAVGTGGGYALGRVFARTMRATNGAETGRASAIVGALSAAASAAQARANVVRRCLEGRGHRVLN